MVTTKSLALPTDKTGETNIEVWTQADRVWIRVSPKTDETVNVGRIAEAFTDIAEVERLGLLERMRLFAQQHREEIDEASKSSPKADLRPHALSNDEERLGSDPNDFFGLSVAEWLQAEALAAHLEALERVTSLDETLTYVNEKCDAVRKP
jgi:hypothetical protein